MSKETKKQFPVRLTEGMIKDIKKAAKEEHTTAASIVRKAIANYLKKIKINHE